MYTCSDYWVILKRLMLLLIDLAVSNTRCLDSSVVLLAVKNASRLLVFSRKNYKTIRKAQLSHQASKFGNYINVYFYCLKAQIKLERWWDLAENDSWCLMFSSCFQTDCAVLYSGISKGNLHLVCVSLVGLLHAQKHILLVPAAPDWVPGEFYNWF